MHVSLAFDDCSHINTRGCSHILKLFRGAPLTSLSLCLPRGVERDRYFRQLASLPTQTALRLEVYDRTEEGLELEDDAVESWEDYSVPRRWSSEQHHTIMQHYWQDGLLGEEVEALRAKYAAGVKSPHSWSPDSSSGYRVFKMGNGPEEDGRAGFFHQLETMSYQ